MTDRDVDVAGVVVGRRDREEGRDRAALDDREPVVVQAPLDVLRAPEVRLDPPADPLELRRLRVAEHRLLRSRPAGHERVAEPPHGFEARDRAVARDGVGGEQHARRLRVDHPLHDDRHLDALDRGALPVGRGTLGGQRGAHRLDVLEHRVGPDDPEERVVLAGERGRRQVLRRRARPDRVRDAGLDPRGNLGRDFAGVAPKRLRRHAEPRRHADPVDPQELAEARALAADERDLRRVHILQTHRAAAQDHAPSSLAASEYEPHPGA